MVGRGVPAELVAPAAPAGRPSDVLIEDPSQKRHRRLVAQMSQRPDGCQSGNQAVFAFGLEVFAQRRGAGSRTHVTQRLDRLVRLDPVGQVDPPNQVLLDGVPIVLFDPLPPSGGLFRLPGCIAIGVEPLMAPGEVLQGEVCGLGDVRIAVLQDG